MTGHVSSGTASGPSGRQLYGLETHNLQFTVRHPYQHLPGPPGSHRIPPHRGRVHGVLSAIIEPPEE
jgi:hypothetical protein